MNSQLVYAGAAIFFGTIKLAGAADEAALQPWTPEVSIGVRYLARDVRDPNIRWAGQDRHNPAERKSEDMIGLSFSPDGRKVFFITHRGDLKRDAAIDELMVYDLAQLQTLLQSTPRPASVPAPAALARCESFSSTYSGICDASWQPDSQAVLFLADDPAGARQVYRLSVTDGKVEAVTREKSGVNRFRMEGGLLKFYVYGKEPTPFRLNYPLNFFTTENSALEIMAAAKDSVGTTDTYIRLASGQTQLLPLAFVDKTWVAPDGAQLVSTGCVRPDDAKRFFLFDWRGSAAQPLLGIPVSPRTPGLPQETAAWNRAGSQVLLLGVLQPATGSTPSGGPVGGVGIWDVGAQRFVPLEPLQDPADAQRHISAAGWRENGEELLVQHERAGHPDNGTVYRLESGVWSGRSVEASVQLPRPPAEAKFSGISVVVRQTANDPPIVVASNGKAELPLLAPDPALDGVWRGRVENFTWTDSQGLLHEGGLLLPRNYQKGQRVPLVIQNYDYIYHLFQPDGEDVNVDAAQSYAQRGMAVLYTGGVSNKNKFPLSEEGPSFVRLLDGAVAALDAAGIVDPKRVGLTGFSRGGYQTFYAITHPGAVTLAAAICADSYTGDYPGYLFERAEIHDDERPVEQESLYEGSFWANKARWLAEATDFNVDRVRTPALFTVDGSASGDVGRFGGQAATLSTISIFHLNHKPLEYVYIPTAQHQIYRPREHHAVMELGVDWLCFWLKGDVPQDPERAARWAILRKQQDEVLKSPAPPKGKWIFALEGTPTSADIKTPESELLAKSREAGVPDSGGNEEKLNGLAYALLYGASSDPAKALTYLQWNVKLFPHGRYIANYYDSLGEGYLQNGDRDHAIEAYGKALELNPHLSASSVTLARLKNEPGSVPELQAQFRVGYALDSADEILDKGGKIDVSIQQNIVSDFVGKYPQAKSAATMVGRLFIVVERAGGSIATVAEAFAVHPNDAVRQLTVAKRARAAVMAKPLELKFTAMDGSEVDVSRLRGKVVLVDFWATWCRPCIEEIPNVVATYNKFRDQGFEVVGISRDKDNKPAAAILEFCQQHQMSWPQCFDVKRGAQAFAKQFGVTAIPAMFLLDQNGMIASTNARGPKLEQEVRRLLSL